MGAQIVPATAEVWVSETVDSRSDAGTHCALRLNAARQSHVAYWLDPETPDAQLVFARRRGINDWSDKEVIRRVRGSHTALAFDSQQRAWIAYYDLEAAAVVVGQRDNVWRLDPVPGALRGFTVGDISLAIIADMPAVLFWSDKGLQLARPAVPTWRPLANDWRIETVDENPLAGISNCLAADAQGVLHATYSDLEGHALRHATRKSKDFPQQPGWTSEVIDTIEGGSAGEHSSLALNPVTSRLHVAYTTSAGLRHAILASGNAADIVEPGAGTGLYPSLGFDSKGNPHVTWYDSNTGKLKVAHANGAFGVPIVVDQSGDAGGFASLAVLSDEVLQVAAYDWAKRQLKFSRLVPPPQAVIRRVPGGTNRLFDLDGSGSTPDPDELTFAWDVPGGGVVAAPPSVTGRTVTLQFTAGASGEFEIGLTVTDLQGRSSKKTTKETV